MAGALVNRTNDAGTVATTILSDVRDTYETFGELDAHMSAISTRDNFKLLRKFWKRPDGDPRFVRGHFSCGGPMMAAGDRSKWKVL
jgi:hypothetical protein